jgi:class 3 adenylate cyclase
VSQSRQLAAIMFTDIVGYSTLMGADEQTAFKLLK